MPWEPRDSDLYARFRAHIIETLGLLPRGDAHRFDYPLPVTEVRTFAGAEAYHDVLRTNWGLVLNDHRQAIRRLESFRMLQETLVATEKAVQHASQFYHRDDGRRLTPEDMGRYFGASVIDPLLLNYLGTLEQPEFDDERFDSVYEPLEEWLLTDCHTLQSIALLHVFRGPETAIQLDKGVRVRRATDQDFTEIVNQVGRENQGIGFGKSLVEATYEVEKSRGMDGTQGLEVIRSVLTALRLAKGGGVHCGTILTRRKGEVLQRSHIVLPTPAIATVYAATEQKDIDRFLEVWRLCRAGKIPERIVYSIRRFNDSYVRWNPEDRMTDLVVALETVFVPDGGAGEIAYKLRTRLVALLGRDTDNEQRKHLRDTVRLAYAVRSALVHGSQIERRLTQKLRKLGLANLQGLCDQLEDLVRSSILLFIREPQLLPAKSMDDAVLGIGAAPKEPVAGPNDPIAENGGDRD